MFTEEEGKKIQFVLNEVIYQIRSSQIMMQIFTYYVSDLDQMLVKNRVKIELNFEGLKTQIKRKILSQRNNYWGLNDEDIKIVEKACEDSSIDQFKDFINGCLKSNLAEKEAEREYLVKQKDEKEKDFIKSILKDKYDLLGEAVLHIIKENRAFPYKSDKIKGFLELEFNPETIFLLMNSYPKLASPIGYINKYKEEREELIKSRKIPLRTIECAIDFIKRQK